MNIISITLMINTHGTDVLLLNTDLPQAVWPFSGYASLKLDVAKGSGMDYVKSNFSGTPLVIIDCVTGETFND